MQHKIKLKWEGGKGGSWGVFLTRKGMGGQRGQSRGLARSGGSPAKKKNELQTERRRPEQCRPSINPKAGENEGSLASGEAGAKEGAGNVFWKEPHSKNECRGQQVEPGRNATDAHQKRDANSGLLNSHLQKGFAEKDR